MTQWRTFFPLLVLLGLTMGACQNRTGLVWSTLPLGSGIQPTAVSCPTVGTCYVVGENGLILKTLDGGSAWSTLDLVNGGPALSNFNLTDISCPTPVLCYITGNQGLILETADGGQTFQIQNETVNGNLTLNSVSCQSALLPACVAVGNNNTVFILPQLEGAWTANLAPQTGIGPANYNQVSLSGTTFYISAISQSGQGVSGLIASSNGGTSFQFLGVSSVQAPQGISGVACQSPVSCVADGPGALLATADGGLNWITIGISGSSSALGYLSSVSATSDGSYWATGSSGSLYQIPQPPGSAGVSGMAFSQTLPSNSLSLTVGGVSCQSAGVCLAIGYSPSVPGAVYESVPGVTSSGSPPAGG
ncbi:MAG: YCF48-related protein [Leptospirales bacterium]